MSTAHEFAALFARLEYEGFSEALRRAVEDRRAWRDESVQLRVGERHLRGILRGLNPDGHLQLDRQGTLESFGAGEIEGLKPDTP